MNIKEKFKNTKLFNIYYFLKYFIENLKNRKLNNEYKNLLILDDERTVEQIVKYKMSFSRFGDGEFLWILKDKKTPMFQENSEELSKKLIEVLESKEKNLLVGIPLNLQYISNATWIDKYFWRKFINVYGNRIKKYLTTNKQYGNTNLTRFYMGYKDKENTTNRIKNLKKIWNKRDLLIVEGELTKMGVGNDLFNNANSIKRIICPSKNAFNKYEEIKQKIIQEGKDKLILIALGPTATVLSYDLSKIDYQAIDIGHIDVEYEWFKKNAKSKIAIEGKAVNESSDKTKEKIKIEDEKYIDEIIVKIL